MSGDSFRPWLVYVECNAVSQLILLEKGVGWLHDTIVGIVGTCLPTGKAAAILGRKEPNFTFFHDKIF